MSDGDIVTRQKWKESIEDKGQLRKTWGGVLDGKAISAITKLIEKGTLKNIIGTVKEGKESKVFWGEGKDFPVAIKVYAVEAADFKKIKNYIAGDPRFKGLGSDKRKLLEAWCNKEYKNLMRAQEAGVVCPKPIAHFDTILVLEFIGEPPVPAPRLTDVELNEDDMRIAYEKTKLFLKQLWQGAKLVHGDLSEYNMLWKEGELYLIDFSQSMVRDHPLALDLLKRDVKNVCRFFKSLGCDEEELLKEVMKND